ncbi:27S pre-rRNA (guanosine(2922)-2'-O)-methyltransferase [Seminavis robusta]|uniref:27S pre-rRNA (Guanosine(2922)-2'-O)-methyltransferase n=1 Tax=Seminavis robusta TaxID=568900 RepID=A0A9N8ECH1_9STRA|nr:27S pre-rRNA (guanosine(2922)-2'-O)-methyltransferase [Seminavis robusta]|eukprot:Sro945_g223150.1 27S pre-rRNA (guanosine(2922)-2'-O)-methyltransferase (1019) ;mRNA; f:28959-32293
MGEKRKKHHDKDKYYNLAKEQGLRSRAAFKLSQINRKFPFLQDARIVLDLCAAPGGWTQIAARTMPRADHTHIVAVDILPIRSFPGFQGRITTLIGDITTAKCKADISKTLKIVGVNPSQNSNNNKKNDATCDLVLHDGAPNVGASYDKDAYEQNEISVHALKCATQHLKARGHFVTKVYRSRDYASYVWVCQQLFETVTAFKPKASRAQSAEIFLICQTYKAPEKIDPRMLDPKHIFEQVEGDSSGALATGDGVHVFHKAWDQKRRQRNGYDMTHFDATMRHIEPVANFINAAGVKDAILILSTCTGLGFTCEQCKPENNNNKQQQESSSCKCQFFLRHPFTTPETKDCVSDLKVLNKGDFKGLLTWRTKMQEALQAVKDMKEDGDDDSDSDDSDDESGKAGGDEDDSDKEEAEIQGEIAELRQKRLREKKKLKKKERAQAAKRRRQAALGMDLNAIDVPEHEKIFSLATINSKGALEAASEVNLDKVTDADIMPDEGEEDIVVDLDESLKKEGAEKDENTGYSYRLDEEMDEAYDRYLSLTKDGLAKSGTKMAKRKKKSKRINALEEAEEDEALLLKTEQSLSHDAKTYAEMLSGPRDSDDSSDDDDKESDDDDDDGFKSEPMTPEEFAATKRSLQAKKEKEQQNKNPLIHTIGEETTSAKTARWFSNPLFANIGQKAESAAARDQKKKKSKDTPKLKGLDAEEVLASMPKTDKQKRHEKRLKDMARDERKKARKAKKLGEAEAAFEIAPANDDDSDGEEEDQKLMHLSESQKKKVLEARELIKAGMGKATGDGDKKGIEIVSEADTQSALPIMDHRKYDSDHEDYDSDDYAETLALGTMTLRHSKMKAFVDASYNRYAWNDPEGLPDWFVDDENKHYRPKLPIPPALIAKIKEKQMALSEKPIKKVAEARARKSKRAKVKLAAAKKKAEAVANNSDMSEAMKLKAISKALRQQDTKKPSKTYVIAKKGRSLGAKGVKLVDKRMKNDKRSMERAVKKGKKGKQNKMTGSKMRRHHK